MYSKQFGYWGYDKCLRELKLLTASPNDAFVYYLPIRYYYPWLGRGIHYSIHIPVASNLINDVVIEEKGEIS